MWPGERASPAGRTLKPGPFRAAPIFVAALLLCALIWPSTAFALGPNAIMRPSGYAANLVARGDDNTIQVVNLPFTMNWFGTSYSQIYINQNGNCTFGSSFTAYTPSGTLASQRQDIMAPFWADVDTRVGGQSTYSDIANPPQVDGHDAFFVNWENVGYYNQHATPSNYFQLVIVDRSDTGAGNFDFYFNYDQILWDTGDASNNYNARAGWARRRNSTAYELPGSGGTGTSTLLDTSSSSTSLIQNYQNPTGQLGRYMWQVRNGASPNQPPKVTLTDRVLEGNVPGGYATYTGAGDATATDPDGTIASFTSTPSLPATLPLGANSILWTATDNRGAVTTDTQSVVVTDTTPPSNPALASTTTAGAWSTVPTVTVSWSGAADVCSGVNGYSYVWSRNGTAVPDAAIDSTGSAATTSLPDGVWYMNLRTVDKAGNWSSATSLGPFQVDRVAPVTTDDAPVTWAKAPVPVTLTATDTVSGVLATLYKLDGAATATYTAPVNVSVEGTHTLQYWSVDRTGNTETTNTATVRVDMTAPSVPTSVAASAVSTTVAQVTWLASADAISGVSAYQIFRDGSLVTTSAAPAFTDSGLNPGSSYGYQVAAVDAAGNVSSRSATVTVTMPSAAISMSVSNADVVFANVVPGATSSITSATVVTVTGVGGNGYDLTCVAGDFLNLDGSSSTPTMPVSALSFSGRGWATFPSEPVSTAGRLVDSSAAEPSVWRHDYVIDMTLDAPWRNAAGTYKTTLVYTAVLK